MAKPTSKENYSKWLKYGQATGAFKKSPGKTKEESKEAGRKDNKKEESKEADHKHSKR